MTTTRLVRLPSGVCQIIPAFPSYTIDRLQTQLDELHAPGNVADLADNCGRVQTFHVLHRILRDLPTIKLPATLSYKQMVSIVAAIVSRVKLDMHWTNEPESVTQLLARLEQRAPLSTNDIELFTLVCVAFLIRPRSYAPRATGVFKGDKRTHDELHGLDTSVKRTRIDQQEPPSSTFKLTPAFLQRLQAVSNAATQAASTAVASSAETAQQHMERQIQIHAQLLQQKLWPSTKA